MSKNITGKALPEPKDIAGGRRDIPRSADTVKSLENRLNRVIGQLGGIKMMLRENRCTSDILIQLSAAEKSVENLKYCIMTEEIETCTAEKIVSGDTASALETVRMLKKLM